MFIILELINCNKVYFILYMALKNIYYTSPKFEVWA